MEITATRGFVVLIETEVTGCSPTLALSYAYTGEYREAPPNLVYLHARWYDPTIGRFLSPDDRLGRLSMPQDQNRYAYVVNNPMAYTDPTGHDFWSDPSRQPDSFPRR